MGDGSWICCRRVLKNSQTDHALTIVAHTMTAKLISEEGCSTLCLRVGQHKFYFSISYFMFLCFMTKVDDDVMMLLSMSIVKDFRHGGREVGKYPHEHSAYRDKNTPDDGQYI